MRKLAAILALCLTLATGALAADSPCCGDFVGINVGINNGDIGTTPPAVASGCYTGNATDDRLIVTGFPPGFVITAEMDNENPVACTYRTSAYPADHSCSTNVTGSCAANNIQSFTNTGFIIGTDSVVNANGQPFCWFATSAAIGRTDIVSYTGDGDTKNVTTTFAPDALMVFPRNETETAGVNRYLTNASLLPTSAEWTRNDDTPFESGQITAFNAAMDVTPPSFTVVGDGVNFDTRQYDAIAWDAQRVAADEGTYIGDNAASRVIQTACEDIAAVFMSCDDGNGIWRTASMLPSFVSEYGPDQSFVATCGIAPTKSGCIGRLGGSTFTVYSNNTAGLDCNDTNQDCAWIAVCAGQELATVPAFNPLSELRAYYDFESAAGAAEPNMAGTECGADCDLTDVNGTTRSTTEFREGTQSGEFNGTDESYTCSRATCANGTTDLNIGTTSSWGCWGRLENDTNSRGVFYGGGNSGNANWAILRNATNDLINCRVTDNADTAVTAAGATNTWQTNTWAFRYCVFDDTANTLSVYRNAVLTGTPQTVNNMRTSIDQDPRIGANQALTATAFFDGQLDGCFLYAGALTTEQGCYLASCGGDGSECTCLESDPTLYVNSGYNDRAGNCALPACNTGGF